ncbi:hypothetical protein [Nostoc sp. KVJ3]|uniref:hypothetical protein n=1 Tax=Nostoc sp. KVJ3 TaxID=457945 RepID=UPI0022374C16|nr:hypothetical protein [Nostoc sp. KVJ3]
MTRSSFLLPLAAMEALKITLLTNENLYQFKIVPASGNPAYTSLVIKSDSARPLPISRPRTPLPLTVEKPQSVPPVVQQPSPPRPQTITVQKSQPVALMRPNPGTTLNGAIQRNDANALALGWQKLGAKVRFDPDLPSGTRCKMLSSYCGVARQEMRQFRFLRSIKPLLINYLNGGDCE